MLVLLTGCMMVQAQSPVIRNGNDYVVDGQVMKKAAFNGYLKNTCPEAYAKFNSGYKTSKAGWGLFGTGIGLGVAAVGMAIATPWAVQDKSDEAVIGYSTGMVLAYVASSLATTSGIICLAVGYGKMHNSADNLYYATCAKKPVAELHLTAGQNGIGLACRF